VALDEEEEEEADSYRCDKKMKNDAGDGLLRMYKLLLVNN